MTAPYSSSRFAYEGTETTETSIVRTGGAEDPTGQAQSRKIVTSANAQWLRPFRCAPWAIWNETTGADVTVTVYGNGASVPASDEVWLELEYQGDVSSTLGKIVSTSKANVLATGAAGTSDSSTWAGGTTAFKLVATLSSPQPGRPGLIHVRPKIGKASATFYLDPKIELTVAAEPAPLTELAFADFVNGVYRISGASVAVGGMWTQDEENYASFDPVIDIDEEGLVSGSPISTPALSAILFTAGYTVVGMFDVQPEHTGAARVHVVSLDLPDFTTSSEARIGIDNSTSINVTTTVIASASGVNQTAHTGFGSFFFAATITSDRTSLSINGGSVLTDTTTDPLTLNLNTASVETQSNSFHIKWVKYHPPQLDAALPGLSFPTSGYTAPAHKSSRYAYEGTETTETSIVRSGGTAHSRKIVTTANSQWLRPYRAEPYAIWNETTGADVTVTVYGAAVLDASSTNCDLFMDVEYLNSTHGSIATTTRSNVLASCTALTSDSSTWAGSSNVAFNPGSIFWPEVALSNNNLTATRFIQNQQHDGAKVLAYRTTGKYYFEVTGGASLNTAMAFGITTASNIYDNVVAGFGEVWVVVRGGVIWNGASTFLNIGLVLPGDVIQIAVDLTARLGWARRNGTGNWNATVGADPATGTSGVTIPSGSMSPVIGFGITTINRSATYNFGATAFAHTPPTGFGNWTIVPADLTNFKLVATLSSPQPGQPGLINVRVKAAKPSSTFYIDPTPILEPASSLGSGGGGGEPVPPDPDVYDPATGDEAPVMQIAVDVDSLAASFAANTISAHGTSAAGTTFTSTSWTSPSASLKYATPTVLTNYLFTGKYYSRDHTLTGWTKLGEVFLRLVSGKAWVFYINHEGAGSLTLRLCEGLTQTTSPINSSATQTYYAPFATSTLNADILAKIPGFDANDTEGHKQKFTVEGLELAFSYSLDGSAFTEIIRWTPVETATWLHMEPGAVAIANITGYGWRDFTIDYNDNPSHLYSDFTETLDVRDLGVKDVQTTGSMTAGSPTLVVANATDLNIGDNIIVDTYGASGAGAPGGRGPGGQWPNLRYANTTTMAADLTKPTDTACSLDSTGEVWHFNGSAWVRDATWNPNYVYMHKSHPMALRAKIIAKSGTILTLNQNAQVTVGSSRVYHDNQPLLAFLADTQDFHVTVPPVELLFPNSRVVMGAALNIQGHAGWSLRGAGSGRANSTPTGRTRFYGPLGCPGPEINITPTFTSVKDIHIDSGGYFFMPQINAQAMAQTEYQVNWPHGLMFTLCSNITVDNVNITQVYQQAVGFRYCHTATVSNCTLRMVDPLGNYIQWMYQSANSTGIRYIDCEMNSDWMVTFCEPFADDGTEYIRCIARNGISSNNTAINTKYTDCGSILEAMSRYSYNSQHVQNPVLQSNSNIGPTSPSTMTVDRFRYLLEGYVDAAKEQPKGIVLSSSAGSVVSNSNLEMLPYDLTSTLNGAQGIICDSSDCTISAVRVDGTTVGDWAGNITAYDATANGTDLINCIADRQNNSQTGGTLTGAQTIAAAGTDRAPAAVSFTPVVAAVAGQRYTSNEITISGVNALLRDVTLTSNAKILWLGNGVVPPVGAGTIRDHDHWVRKILRDGDKLKLIADASLTPGGVVTATLQLASGQSYNWTITTA